jgi:hypothetical protein
MIHANFFLDLFLHFEIRGNVFVRNVCWLWLTSRKTELFLTTAVRTSNPTKVCFCGSLRFLVCPLNLVSTSNHNSWREVVDKADNRTSRGVSVIVHLLQREQQLGARECCLQYHSRADLHRDELLAVPLQGRPAPRLAPCSTTPGQTCTEMSCPNRELSVKLCIFWKVPNSPWEITLYLGCVRRNEPVASIPFLYNYHKLDKNFLPHFQGQEHATYWFWFGKVYHLINWTVES